jgi:hypothetical protein
VKEGIELSADPEVNAPLTVDRNTKTSAGADTEATATGSAVGGGTKVRTSILQAQFMYCMLWIML